MSEEAYQAGDHVTVTSYDNTGKPRVDVWVGILMRPSVLGEGWWLVIRLRPHTKRNHGQRMVTVPEYEMTILKRRSW